MEKRRCVTMSGITENIKSSDKRMCREFIPVEEVLPGKINVEVEEWLRDVEKRKKRTTGV